MNDVKVAFTLNPFQGVGGGSYSFARVLAETLPRFGIDVVFDCNAAVDVLLVFAHYGTRWLLRRHRRRGALILHRLDERIDPHEAWARRRKHHRIARLNSYADITVFQSDFVRGNMGPICGAPAGCVIHNGVDPRVFSADGPRVPLEGSPAALHVSWSIGESKRLDRIAELLAVAPPGLRLYCVGRHAESGQGWLTDPRVEVLGVKSRGEVAELMRSADILFFPSEFEPCPNIPIEAMACGLPCLYHPSGGTPEVVGDVGVPMTASLRDDLIRVLEVREVLRGRAILRAPEFWAERVVAKYAKVMNEMVRQPMRASQHQWRRLWNRFVF